jgi:hypothetical protein
MEPWGHFLRCATLMALASSFASLSDYDPAGRATTASENRGRTWDTPSPPPIFGGALCYLTTALTALHLRARAACFLVQGIKDNRGWLHPAQSYP